MVSAERHKLESLRANQLKVHLNSDSTDPAIDVLLSRTSDACSAANGGTSSASRHARSKTPIPLPCQPPRQRLRRRATMFRRIGEMAICLRHYLRCRRTAQVRRRSMVVGNQAGAAALLQCIQMALLCDVCGVDRFIWGCA